MKCTSGARQKQAQVSNISTRRLVLKAGLINLFVFAVVRRVDEAVRVRSELPALTALVYARGTAGHGGPDDPVVAAIRAHLDEPRAFVAERRAYLDGLELP